MSFGFLCRAAATLGRERANVLVAERLSGFPSAICRAPTPLGSNNISSVLARSSPTSVDIFLYPPIHCLEGFVLKQIGRAHV